MLSEKAWRPEQVLQLLARVFASMMAGILLVGLLTSIGLLEADQLTYVSLAVGTLSFHGMALILTHLFLRSQNLTWRQAFGFWSGRFGRTLLLAVVVGITVLPIAWALGQLSAKVMTLLDMEPVVQGPVQLLQTAASVPAKILIGCLAILVAPFVEELVFRGLIYPLVKQLGFPKLALWGNSLLFAIIHNNLMILVPLTFLALVLTLLYETTDDLLAPVIAHSLFNFVNFSWLITQPLWGPPVSP